ncbi:CaiB/BaiF CoA transferase family protein [Sphingomonas corticis]|uniref:CoA transferase n=1 Tax=Sphingomonas corticis TaxID=2722791 RepID=A0ABX1CTV6_9SPHN|nr:CaiB/BaiF CoA-transferase family protein [Sphingomonas corticis]NJR80073.1 CoA transferase [Sphingomonas corticis]
MTGSLSGIRVVDCTHVIAGSWCSMLLADLGADVVKVEPILGEVTRGDPKRRFRPFDFVNRNKRAIAVDLSEPGGRDVVRRLAAGADVFVENYRPGALERLGLAYADLSPGNPGLVYCSISGFGTTGPYRDRGGFDLVAQAMSGIMSLTGEVGGETPVACGVPISDLNAGVFGALAVVAALNERNRSGLGQRVETSLLESALAYTVWETGAYLTEGTVAARAGSRHRLAAPYEAFPTSDGHVVVGVNSPRLWSRFCSALGLQELVDDPRFADGPSRVANREALHDLIARTTSREATAFWVDRLEEFRIPGGPINDIAQALADPQVEARSLLAEVGGRRFVRTPIMMDRTPVELRRGPAAVGEHTAAVLRECGYEDAEIEALQDSGAIACRGDDDDQ